MKNICLIIPSLRHGGAERVISLLANEWAINPNLSVTLLILTKQKHYYKLDNRVKIIEPFRTYDNNLFSKYYYTIWSLCFIRKTINNLKPDAILSFCERYNNLVLLSLLGKRFNIFISDRNNPNNYLGKLHEFLRIKLYKNACGIIAQTEIAKQILFKKTNNKNISVIPNPLRNLVEYKEIVKENIILNIGRFEKQKNQEMLIEIFASLKNAEDWKLVIIGVGTLKDNLETKINQLDLEERVILLEFKEDIDYYFQKAKIFSFTSIYEGFPNALSEAMANGLPVIAFDCPTGPAELIINNFNGSLIPLLDVNLYIEKLQELIDDENIRISYSKQAINIKEQYSKTMISNQYLKFILNEASN